MSATGQAPRAAPAPCAYASRRDTLLSSGRRPRLADLVAEVEQVRGDSFRADWRLTDLIRHAKICGAPDPGIICPDDGPEFAELQAQVRAALKLEARKLPDLARDGRRALCSGAPPNASGPRIPGRRAWHIAALLVAAAHTQHGDRGAVVLSAGRN
ncbi:hypothetical protein ACFTZF_48795 [Streptomyces mirabilis]|uniref:hypothetical protein n=1 Tax=Streptomyces mirabilis TaxID=68239 RepID=UPI0036266C00